MILEVNPEEIIFLLSALEILYNFDDDDVDKEYIQKLITKLESLTSNDSNDIQED